MGRSARSRGKGPWRRSRARAGSRRKRSPASGRWRTGTGAVQHPQRSQTPEGRRGPEVPVRERPVSPGREGPWHYLDAQMRRRPARLAVTRDTHVHTCAHTRPPGARPQPEGAASVHPPQRRGAPPPRPSTSGADALRGGVVPPDSDKHDSTPSS